MYTLIANFRLIRCTLASIEIRDHIGGLVSGDGYLYNTLVGHTRIFDEC